MGKKIELGSIFKPGDEKNRTEAEIVGLVRNAHYFDVQDKQQEAIFTELFQVQPEHFKSAQTLIIRMAQDVRVFAASAVVLAVAGLVASTLPARRALKADPMAALRYQ